MTTHYHVFLTAGNAAGTVSPPLAGADEAVTAANRLVEQLVHAIDESVYEVMGSALDGVLVNVYRDAKVYTSFEVTAAPCADADCEVA
jgi:hypothetical protein